jgi:hypothetical protein
MSMSGETLTVSWLSPAPRRCRWWTDGRSRAFLLGARRGATPPALRISWHDSRCSTPLVLAPILVFQWSAWAPNRLPIALFDPSGIPDLAWHRSDDRCARRPSDLQHVMCCDCRSHRAWRSRRRPRPTPPSWSRFPGFNGGCLHYERHRVGGCRGSAKEAGQFEIAAATASTNC